jgi:LPS-assembly protein
MTRRLPSLHTSVLPRLRLLPLLLQLAFGGSVCAQQAPTVVNKFKDDGQEPTVLEAGELTGLTDREIRLRNKVRLKRGVTTVDAEDIKFDVVDDRVDALGKVSVLRDGSRFDGNSLSLKLDTGEGFMESPVYRLLTRSAHGRAERIDFDSGEVATITNGFYTTCQGSDPDWYLKTGKLTLDEGAGIGRARNAMLVFKGVPLAGTPYISFPLAEERVSGFLPPTIASSTRSGLQITTPYYWNIAPNRDVTLYPHYFVKRGLMLGANARYLERDAAGDARLEFINDTDYGQGTRYAVSYRHNQQLDHGVKLAVDYNKTSDNDYARDFPFSYVFDRPGFNRRLMPQSVSLSYGSTTWDANLRLSEFQVLQDPRLAIRPIPYSRLPQVTLNNFLYGDNGLDLTMATQLTRFSHPTEIGGSRLVVNPRISYQDFQGPGYFIRPSMSVHATMYSLDRVDDPGMTAPSRVLPTMSVDSGLMFERPARFLGRDAVQTLEPRAFYTYTPYRAQNSNLYPNFDTTEADISFAQLFRENRFVGNDRIGDANQLTLALISRYLETNGSERLRLGLAQRFNFDPQRVGLGTAEQISTQDRSDLLLLASGRVTEQLRIDANFQFDQQRREVNRLNIGAFWQPGPMKVFNAQYRRDTRNLPADIFPNTNFELIDMSAQWPIADRWYGVGRINYLIGENRVGQALAGIEHQADCWIFRAVGQRQPTASGVINTMFFVQLELNGLSSIGMNPLTPIRRNVPGYQPLGSQ